MSDLTKQIPIFYWACLSMRVFFIVLLACIHVSKINLTVCPIIPCYLIISTSISTYLCARMCVFMCACGCVNKHTHALRGGWGVASALKRRTNFTNKKRNNNENVK